MSTLRAQICVLTAFAFFWTDSLTAGPFGFRRHQNGPANGTQTVGGGAAVSSDGELWSAQGVANRISRTGIFRHWGNPAGGFEGIGIGASPSAAEWACCYRRSMTPREVGIARMSNGAFVACCRY